MGEDVTAKIVIVGEYGIRSLGDEAMLQAMGRGIAEQLDGDVSFCVLSRLALVPWDAEPYADYQVRVRDGIAESVRGLTTALRGQGDVQQFWDIGAPQHALEQADLVIIGGGTLLVDANPSFLFGPMMFYPAVATMARAFGVPVMTMAQSIGPLRSTWGQKTAAEFLGLCDAVTVRDRASLEIARELGREDAQLFPDPALGLEPLGTDTLPETDWIAVAARYWDVGGDAWLESFAGALDEVAERTGARLALVPHCRFDRYPVDDDRRVAEGIMHVSADHERMSLLGGDGSLEPERVLRVYQQCDAAITVRLHGAVFAAAAGTPFVALNYWPKVEGFCEWVESPCKGMEPDEWVEPFLAMWDEREAERRRLRARVAELRELTAQQYEVVEGLLC